MKEIPLTQGKVTIVDDDTYEWASLMKWHANGAKNSMYVVHTFRRGENKKRVTIFLHRLVAGLLNDDPREADHRNHNTLDNQRENLRVCVHLDNCHNHVKLVGTSKYKGVCQYDTTGKWRAQICVNHIVKHLGCYINELDAALAYDVAALRYYGEFANLNFPVKQARIRKDV